MRSFNENNQENGKIKDWNLTVQGDKKSKAKILADKLIESEIDFWRADIGTRPFKSISELNHVHDRTASSND